MFSFDHVAKHYFLTSQLVPFPNAPSPSPSSYPPSFPLPLSPSLSLPPFPSLSLPPFPSLSLPPHLSPLHRRTDRESFSKRNVARERRPGRQLQQRKQLQRGKRLLQPRQQRRRVVSLITCSRRSAQGQRYGPQTASLFAEPLSCLPRSWSD